MATNWPAGVDTFTNPSASDALDSVSVPHADQHANLNDAVAALQAHAGLVLVKPTSASGATIDANGIVSISSGASSVTIDGVFSARFRNYRVLISSLQGSTYANLKMAFVSSSGIYYGAMSNMVYTGSTGYTGTNGASEIQAVANYTTGAEGFASFDVSAPYVAARTTVSGTGYGRDTAWHMAAFNTASGSYTGFILTPSSGTLSNGVISIYGYNNG